LLLVYFHEMETKLPLCTDMIWALKFY
jgi:hypothetical protein